MTGVIYARYSSDNQREESIEGQTRENRAFAEKNGIEMRGRQTNPKRTCTWSVAVRVLPEN